MTENGRSKNIAVFIDYENFARDFDVAGVLSRLKERGRIVIKRAYADWGRFENAKQAMIRSAVELIEVPTRSGKNHADIKLVVDAVETALTKDFVDIFVIASGDSDFIPLVAKLRELNRYVVVISSKPDKPVLMAEYCDELLYYASPLKNAAENAASAVKSNGKGSAAPELPRVPAVATKSKSAPAEAIVSRAPLLKMLVWAAHPDLISGRNGQSEPSPWISLSQVANHLRNLYPALTLTDYGLPRKGALARFVESLQADGYLEMDASLTENKQYMFRKTAKWPVLTADDVPPATFEEMCFNQLAHPRGYHFDRPLLERLADEIGQLLGEFAHNGQELSLREIMRLVKATQMHVDGTQVSEKQWLSVFRTMVAAGVLHDGQGTALPRGDHMVVVRGCLSSTDAIERVGEFLRGRSANQAVDTTEQIPF